MSWSPSGDVDVVDSRRGGALGHEEREQPERFGFARGFDRPPDRVPTEGARGHRRVMTQRALVPPEGGEHDAALARLVVVVDQEAGHGSQIAAADPLRHQESTPISHPDSRMLASGP